MMKRKKKRILMVGDGWRTDFYYAAAGELCEEFEICAVLAHREESIERIERKRGVRAVLTVAEALEAGPDYAVLSVPWEEVEPCLGMLMEAGLPVLCETPPGGSPEAGRRLIDQAGRLHGRVQVAEQYFFQPYYSAILNLVKSGTIGEVSNVSMSMVHGYHAVSIYRKIMDLGYMGCSVSGKKYHFPVQSCRVFTKGVTEEYEKLICAERLVSTLEFSNGKTAFHDFSDEQYHSRIRNQRMDIQGTRGEIIGMDVYYINDKGRACRTPMVRTDDGRDNLNGWSHRGIEFCGKTLYENPFPGARLNDDEIAVASCMRAMGEYVETGREFYPLEEGVWDARIFFAQEEAARTGETVIVKSEPF